MPITFWTATATDGVSEFAFRVEDGKMILRQTPTNTKIVLNLTELYGLINFLELAAENLMEDDEDDEAI